jgi:hypothetical protein
LIPFGTRFAAMALRVSYCLLALTYCNARAKARRPLEESLCRLKTALCLGRIHSVKAREPQGYQDCHVNFAWIGIFYRVRSDFSAFKG